MLSNEYVDDSDLESSEDGSSEAVTQDEKSQTSKASLKSSKINGISNPSKHNKNRSEVSKSTSRASATRISEEDSSAESDSSSTDSDSEDSETKSSQSRKRQAVETPNGATEPSPKKSKAPDSTARIAPKPFKAPSGFEPLSGRDSADISETTNMFSNTEGQQIWYISAPDTLDIESIKSLDLQEALKGNVVHTKDNHNYSMISTPIKDEVLLLPKHSSGSYTHSQARIAHAFHFREVSSQVSPDKSSLTTADNVTSNLDFTAQKGGQKKPPRQQPQGLKMRYLPYGVVQSEVSETSNNDIIMEDHFVDVADTAEGATSSKLKKKKKSKEINEVGLDPMEMDVQTSVKSRKSSKLSRSEDGEPKPHDKKKKKKLRDEAVL